MQARLRFDICSNLPGEILLCTHSSGRNLPYAVSRSIAATKLSFKGFLPIVKENAVDTGPVAPPGVCSAWFTWCMIRLVPTAYRHFDFTSCEIPNSRCSSSGVRTFGLSMLMFVSIFECPIFNLSSVARSKFIALNFSKFKLYIMNSQYQNCRT